jgi:hypothetical protein
MKIFSEPSNSGSYLHPSDVSYFPYDDAEDREMHRLNIERLAEEVHRTIQELAPLYENVLARMKRRARIHDFLSVLVTKNVKQILRSHH